MGSQPQQLSCARLNAASTWLIVVAQYGSWFLWKGILMHICAAYVRGGAEHARLPAEAPVMHDPAAGQSLYLIYERAHHMYGAGVLLQQS